jgi:DNA processing protein
VISGEERYAYLTLAMVPGIGARRLEALLGYFGSAAAVLSATPSELKVVRGIGTAAGTAIKAAGLGDAYRSERKVAELGGGILLSGDPGFPSSLADIDEAPPALFYLGDSGLLAKPCVALVGSRDHTSYGSSVARNLSAGLVSGGLVVVSGMARGIDAIAQQAALDAGGATIGVLGNGLGVVYPAANRKLYDAVTRSGCLLTEFPPGERPSAGSFPRRNRLISGLCRVTVLVEAGERSGALITADAALQQGREVMAVPGPVTSPTSVGCNRLIQQGARPVLGARDILEEYGRSSGRTDPLADVTLSGDESKVMTALIRTTQTAQDLSLRLGWRISDTLVTLTSLEVKGLVVRDEGRLFRRALRET